MSTSPQWNTIWITGASTGIGREVALKLADTGAQIAISARSADKLAELAALKPNIHAYPLDVTDFDAVQTTAAQIRTQHGGLDLVILNAGAYSPQRADISFSAQQCKDTMAINYGGVVNGIEAVLPDMVSRDRGRIAIVASVAGFRGLPRASSYSPTKAAEIALAESIELDLTETNVDISVINPGFVKTPLTDGNDFPMPFIIEADEAADLIIAGLKKGKYDITFPWRMRLVMKLLRIMPNWLFFKIVKGQVVQQRAQYVRSKAAAERRKSHE